MWKTQGRWMEWGEEGGEVPIVVDLYLVLTSVWST